MQAKLCTTSWAGDPRPPPTAPTTYITSDQFIITIEPVLCIGSYATIAFIAVGGGGFGCGFAVAFAWLCVGSRRGGGGDVEPRNVRSSRRAGSSRRHVRTTDKSLNMHFVAPSFGTKVKRRASLVLLTSAPLCVCLSSPSPMKEKIGVVSREKRYGVACRREKIWGEKRYGVAGAKR